MRYAQWAGTVDRYGHGETNDRGLRLLEFCKQPQDDPRQHSLPVHSPLKCSIKLRKMSKN